MLYKFKHIAYRIHRMKTMIFVSQDLPNWYKQCNAHRLLDPQVRKPPVTKWQNVKKSKTPFGVFIVAGYTGERKNQWKSDKMWRKSLKPIWCFHCCSQERLLPLRPNSRRVLLQIGGEACRAWLCLGSQHWHHRHQICKITICGKRQKSRENTQLTIFPKTVTTAYHWKCKPLNFF